MTVKHVTFALERSYPVPPARVFAAWADPTAKAQWFRAPEPMRSLEYALDFRVGGREISRVAAPGEPVHAYDARYQDIVPDRRIIYAYDMHVDEVRISVSLATVEISAGGDGSRVVMTEQGVFLDERWDGDNREQGTVVLLSQLEHALTAAGTAV
ncbi:MAG TPA: SRPBCC family protein [Solirubrobacteraceae bacterium]|jgi:uncharacterized protein YndB with AHSA1/START domain|nr:SRPBCC family protein [Solirubrobacteraceae bacterium]